MFDIRALSSASWLSFFVPRAASHDQGTRAGLSLLAHDALRHLPYFHRVHTFLLEVVVRVLSDGLYTASTVARSGLRYYPKSGVFLPRLLQGVLFLLF